MTMIAFLQIIVMFVLHGLRDEHGTTMTVEGYVPEVAVHMMGLFQFFLFFAKRFDSLPHMHCLVR